METVENNGEQFIQLGDQLVKLGNQLQTEWHAKALKEFEESFILPESEDFLTEFSWEINNHPSDIGERNVAGWPRWEVIGTPVSAYAKSIMEMTSEVNKLPNQWVGGVHPKVREFQQRLQSWAPSDEPTAWPPDENLRWSFGGHSKTTESLAAWLHTFNHLHFTNLSEAADKIREIIEKEKAEVKNAFEKRHGDLEEALKNLYCAQGNSMELLPVAAGAIDWIDVAYGKQQAPKLLNILGVNRNRSEGDWIYVGPPKDAYGDLDHPYLGWNYSTDSIPPAGALSQERAIAYTQERAIAYMENAPYRLYSALYRYKGNGIAELVASKHRQVTFVHRCPVDDKGDTK